MRFRRDSDENEILVLVIVFVVKLFGCFKNNKFYPYRNVFIKLNYNDF